MSQSIQVDGLDQFRRELKSISPALVKEMAKLNQEAAQIIVDKVEPKTAQQRKVIAGVKAARQARGAVVRTQNTTRHPFAIGAFFGARRYHQFPEWIGNQWDPGDSVDGRYGVAFAVHDGLEEVMDRYGDGLEELARRAFPDRY